MYEFIIIIIIILSNYLNFINTVALLKYIIKRTILTLTDNFHSVQWFKNKFFIKNQFILLNEFSLRILTLQISLQVYILSNHLNFNDTVALFKCIIKRTMLTLTDNVYSICKF